MKYEMQNKIFKFKLLLLAIFFMLPNFSQAAPEVFSVSGIVSDGQQISISGSGFGVDGPVVRFFDDFEQGNLGEVVEQNNPIIGSYHSIGPQLYYSDLNSLSGSKAMLTDNSTNNLGNNAVVSIPDDPEVFVSWWEVIPAGDPMPSCDHIDGCNWKMVWFIRDGVSAEAGMSDMVQYVLLNSTGSSVLSSSNSGISFGYLPAGSPNNWQAGRWTRVWSYVKSSTVALGAYDSWFMHAGQAPINFKNLTDVQTLKADATGPYNQFNFPGYTRITASRPTYDDIYVATGVGARARIEIGNASTYVTSTNLTLATVNSWSDTSVTAKIRQGSFANDQNAYLYVFDKDGNVNASGYPITIGSGALDATPPSSPSGLSVQ